MLVYGMIAWLGVITIAAVVVFVLVHLRLRRTMQSLDDAEIGSMSSGSSRTSRRSSVADQPGTVAETGSDEQYTETLAVVPDNSNAATPQAALPRQTMETIPEHS